MGGRRLPAGRGHLLRTEEPLLDLHALTLPGFAPSPAAGLLASAALVSTFLFLSVYGQVSAGLTASRTGLLFLELFAGFMLGSRLGTRRYERVGARSVYVLGGLLGAAGFGWLAQSVTHLDAVSLGTLAGPLALGGAGIGFVLTPAQADVLRAAERDHDAYGRIAAVTQTARYIGGALGIAGLGAPVTTHLGRMTDPRADYAAAVRLVFGVLAAVMLAVSVIGRRRPR